MEKELRSKAKELLESGQVKAVIGYEAGSVPFKCTPMTATTPADADRLVWNPTCTNNLAVYLPQAVKQGKVAVVVKPCDVKSVVELVKEHQIKRDDVMTIVVGCPGVLNMDALAEVDLGTIKSIAWSKDGTTVSTESGDVVIPKEKAFLSKCLLCDINEPSMVDVAIGKSPARQPQPGGNISIQEYEKLSAAERRAFWSAQFEKCIRCYACRQACPACYCNECFVDKHGEIWASKATDSTSNWFFHMTRAMHLAGRCIGCAECVRACPMNIPLGLLNRKIAADVEEMFACDPGTNQEAPVALGTFEMNDPDPCPE